MPRPNLSVTVHGHWTRQCARSPPGSSRRTQRLAVGYRQIPLSARVEQGQNKIPDLLHTGSSQSVVTTPAANLVHRRDKPDGVPVNGYPFPLSSKRQYVWPPLFLGACLVIALECGDLLVLRSLPGEAGAPLCPPRPGSANKNNDFFNFDRAPGRTKQSGESSPPVCRAGTGRHSKLKKSNP